MNQRVKTICALPNAVPVGVIGFIKEMPRERLLAVDFGVRGVRWVYDDEIEPCPHERRINVDPVVRDMYDALKATTNVPSLDEGLRKVQKQVNAAIGQAQKHFKWLTQVTLEEKESVVDETFPGIYRETKAAEHIYTCEEWAAMMDVLYVKALHSRNKEASDKRVVTGSIKPIEAKNLKNLS